MSAVDAHAGEAATRADLVATAAELRSEIARLESRLTWKAVGLAAAIVAALRLWP